MARQRGFVTVGSRWGNPECYIVMEADGKLLYAQDYYMYIAKLLPLEYWRQETREIINIDFLFTEVFEDAYLFQSKSVAKGALTKNKKDLSRCFTKYHWLDDKAKAEAVKFEEALQSARIEEFRG